MSATSSGAGQVITLPQGGGAVRGIGETFTPDLQTGTGNLTVPIQLPAGRHGVQPSLSLGYSTGAGNGPFGLGWSLSTPGVTRRTSHGLPTYDDDRDVFVLSGAEDLVAVGSVGGVTRYRPRTEGLFARIEHHRGDGGNFWRTWTRDGSVSHYGTPRPAAAPAGWRDPAVLADPAAPDRIFGWRLTRTADTFGNHVSYEYVTDVDDVTGHDKPLWTQSYLAAIRYVDHVREDGTAYLVGVTLDYEDRPDVLDDHRARFGVRTRWRCRQLSIHSGTTLVRTATFGYDTSGPGLRSLLTSITVCGHDGDRDQELPRLEFTYRGFDPAGRTFDLLKGSDLPAGSLADPRLDLVDLDGNGLPDLVELGEGVRYWRNLGDGRFDRPRLMHDAPAGTGQASAGQGGAGQGGAGPRLLDADGDGRLELVTDAGWYPLTRDGKWDHRGFRRYERAPSFGFDDPEVRLLDLNGDGVTDALRTGSRLECYFHHPEQGWHETRFVEREQLAEFPDVSFADPRVRLADLTGDGLTDIVLVHDGRTEYWPALGGGDWAPRRTMRNSPRFPEGYDPARVLLGDVDGDGLADLVYVNDGSVTLWINQSGQGWSAPIEIVGTPRVADTGAVRLADVLGCGVAGLLWSDADGPRWSFLDFTGGAKPDVLVESVNNLGASIRVTYAPSTRFYLADARTPATRWATPLPFPVQVVAAVETTDAISGGRLTTEYRYHHGYWDGHEREFRGFGRVDCFDTETVAGGHASPPVEIRTWFHLGPVDDGAGDWAEADHRGEYWPGDPPVLPRPDLDALLATLPRSARRDALRALRGQTLRTELYALDRPGAPPVTVTEASQGVREEDPPAPGSDRRRIFFPFVPATRTTQWDGGDEPMTRLDFTDDRDAYGHPRSSISLALPRGRGLGPGEACLATQSVTSYAERDDADRYLVGRTVTTTTYEVRDQGTLDVFGLHAAALAGTAPREVIGQATNFYDGPAFVGLPVGRLGEHGLLSRTETLVATPELLADAYDGLPPYLVPGGDPMWTDDYPAEFRALLKPLAGYAFRSGGPQVRGYHAVSAAHRYDPRGLLVASRDPSGAETTIEYDAFDLLPTRVTDPAGLVTSAEHDYRVFGPAQVTDPNGNRTAVRYTPLGLVEGTAVLGKPGQVGGDTLDVPGSRVSYDLLAYHLRKEPVSARTVRRVHHATDPDAPPDERDATIESVGYSDGFGRLVQTRSQATDVAFGDPVSGELGAVGDDLVGRRVPDRVIVSGWQVYDNKGRVVERYEPFFAIGYDYGPPSAAELGRRVVMRYDARGRLLRSISPDGSEQSMVYGVPARLDDPDGARPTPWESYAYDANDNAGRTHPDVAIDYRGHWDTPSSVLVDALGRTVRTATRDAVRSYTAESVLDVRGNVLALTDELGRTVYRRRYDLAGRVLREEAMDGGTSWTVYDAAGQPVESRDAKGARTLLGHDDAGRPVRNWAADGIDGALTLRGRVAYGGQPDSGLSGAEAAAANLLGQPVLTYDEAGLSTVLASDFKGNPTETARQVFSAEVVLAQRPADWQPPPGGTLAEHATAMLDPAVHRTSTWFDGLDRQRMVLGPEAVDGHRPVLVPRYDSAGGLVSVELDGAVFVERMAHDALGRRSLVVYGNGVLTAYRYHRTTLRLSGLRSTRYATTGPFTYRPTGAPLQDLGYLYDLVGNLLTLNDGDLVRRFTYDPRYQLVAATGREHDLPPVDPPWLDRPGGTDLTRTRPYTERYEYDPAGNLTLLRHETATGASNRVLTPAVDSNRLASLVVGQTTVDYAHDRAGNLVREAGVRHFDWDHADRLREFRTQTGDAEPSVHGHYRYGAAGQRVLKLVRKQGGILDLTVYLDGFEYHRHVQGTSVREANTLHVLDGDTRIATVRIGPAPPDDHTPAVKYVLGDHLGSANLTLDDTGALVGREEYTPYGETSFGSFAYQRYRFTGKERDEESGLYYHGARYYAPWLARWMCPDPAGTVDGTNLYAYARGNPMGLVDPTGTTASKPPVDAKSAPTPANPTPGPAPALPPGVTPDDLPKGFDEIGIPIYDTYTGPEAKPPEAPDPYFANRITPEEASQRHKKLQGSPMAGLLILGPNQDKASIDRGIDAGANLWGVVSALAGGFQAGRPKPENTTGGQTSGQSGGAAAGKPARQGGLDLPALTNRAGERGYVPVDPVKLAKIKAALERKGVVFETRQTEIDQMRAVDAAAQYRAHKDRVGPGVIVWQDPPSRSEVVEEIKHWDQHRRSGYLRRQDFYDYYNGMFQLEMKTQIELHNIKSLKWTAEELAGFRENHKFWRTQVTGSGPSRGRRR